MEYITSVIELMRNVINEEEKREILQTDFQPMLNLLLDLTTLFPDQRKEAQEALNIWMQLLHNSFTEATGLLHRPQPGRPRRCLDRLICNPRTLSQEINEWKVFFNCLFRELQSDLSIFVTARQIIHSTHPIPALSAEGSEQLYQSYDALPTSDLKNCFLYCAMFEKDAKINVEDLVQMWIAEGFVRSKQETHLMDMAIGRTYVNLLLHRSFFRNDSPDQETLYNCWQSSYISVGGDIREMATQVLQGDIREQNCLFKATQGMQNFPTEDIKDCKRISLGRNQIENLPSEFPCRKLVSLMLSHNSIRSVPSGFLVGLKSLKVLDLSYNERLSSIPSSVGQLRQLQLLRLEGLDIEELPEEIGHLSSLQFLNLCLCIKLRSLPSQIGQLQNLKYLNIKYCFSLRAIPHEISQLTSLTTLDAEYGPHLSVEAESDISICRLKGLINLIMLRIKVEVYVKEGNRSSGIEGGIMGTWLDMRHLWLDFVSYGHGSDYVMDDLPDDMQNMRKLQSLVMEGYKGLSLPKYSCKFQHLQHLELIDCRHLKGLSPLEWLPNLKHLEFNGWPELKELGIGNYGKATGFSMLEVLVLRKLEKLESMVGASNSGVWNERTLPRLCSLNIVDCPNLKRFPIGMDKLLNLKILKGQSDWWHQIIWEDEPMKTHFTNLFKK